MTTNLDLIGYDSFEKIGQGGMATVWKARQISLDRPVAIKILSSSDNANDEDIDQFQSEARIAASLNHNGIVQVYDAFYRNNLFCFVMEYVDGQTISQWIKSRGRLTESECLFVAKGVATALDYAWNYKKLVHCDIKPDNVMIDSDGTVKVTDLGLCRGIGAIQTRRLIRESNNPEEILVYGTPSFVSPEQALGRDNLLPQADMYSLGAMLYNMIMGKHLFSTQNVDNIMELQVSSQDEDIYNQITDISPIFCDFIERLLSKQPEHRYETWGDVLIDIDRISQKCPLTVGPLDLTKAVSTMKRCERREKKHATYPKLEAIHMNEHTRLQVSSQKLHEAFANIELNKMKKQMYKKLIGIASALVLVVLVIGISIGTLINSPASTSKESTTNTPNVEITIDPKVSESIEKELEETNNKHFNRIISDTETIRRYDKFLKTSGISPELKEKITGYKKDVETNLQKKKNKVLEKLKKEANSHISKGNIREALNYIQSYNGELASETTEERKKMLDDIAKRYRK